MLEQEDDSGKPSFLRIAFEEYYFAMLDGKNHDSDYVKKMAYTRYENELRNKAVKSKT